MEELVESTDQPAEEPGPSVEDRLRAGRGEGVLAPTPPRAL